MALIQQGTDDPRPIDVLMARVREVIVRTDLWSDEIVVLRTLQSLAMLDIHHYCRMVWTLGGYGETGSAELPARLPSSPDLVDWSDPLAAIAGA